MEIAPRNRKVRILNNGVSGAVIKNGDDGLKTKKMLSATIRTVKNQKKSSRLKTTVKTNKNDLTEIRRHRVESKP
jgi:hypothetical protein